MLKRNTAFVAAALVALGAVAFAGGRKKDKNEPKPTVVFAKSWDAAIKEAKELNVPLVVHSHGFY